MTFMPKFFQLLDTNKPLVVPAIEPKSLLEKTLDEFLKTKISSITLGQLAELNKTLLEAHHPNCLDNAKIHEEYKKNQQAIDKLLQIGKPEESLNQEPVIALENIEITIQLFLQRNKTLIETSKKFANEQLNKTSTYAVKLLKKTKSHQLDNWSKVTEAIYDRIHRDRHAPKLSMKALKQKEIEINNTLNKLHNAAKNPRKPARS